MSSPIHGYMDNSANSLTPLRREQNWRQPAVCVTPQSCRRTLNFFSNFNFSGSLKLLEGKRWQEYNFFLVHLKKAILGKIEIYDVVFLALCKSGATLIAAEHKNVLWITWFAHKMIMFGILNVKVWFMKAAILHALIGLTVRCILVWNRQNNSAAGFQEWSTSGPAYDSTFLSAPVWISRPPK